MAKKKHLTDVIDAIYKFGEIRFCALVTNIDHYDDEGSQIEVTFEDFERETGKKLKVEDVLYDENNIEIVFTIDDKHYRVCGWADSYGMVTELESSTCITEVKKEKLTINIWVDVT